MLKNGVQYPTDIDQTKWDEYMQDFKTYGIGTKYTNATIRINQPPKAILKIIQLANEPNSGCNPANGTH